MLLPGMLQPGACFRSEELFQERSRGGENSCLYEYSVSIHNV